MNTTGAGVLGSRALAVALVLAVTCSERASATGFFINQQSVRGLGRVDAGNTVAADELATIFFNPAGLLKPVHDPKQPRGVGLPKPADDSTRRRRVAISGAFYGIIPRSDQRNRGSVAATPGTVGAFVPIGGGDAHNPTGPSPALNVYAAMPAGENGAIGLAANVPPFGLKTEFDRDWHGRYDATQALLKTMNVSLVFARRLGPQVSIGGGLDLQYAATELATAIPNPFVPGGPAAATDATIRTEGHDWVTPGFNVGVLYAVDSETRVGVHYRSGMKHDITGTSEVSGLPGPLAGFNGTIDATARLSLPAVATAGISRQLTRTLTLFGEFEWFNWSTFDEVRIRFADGRADGVRPANFRDAYAVAVGAESPVGRKWIARGGVHYDTTPTVDDFRDTTVPDSERLWLGVGTTYKVTDRLDFDVAFNHVFFRDTAIALTRTFFDNTAAASTVRINSGVTSIVNTVAMDFRFTF